MQLKLVVTKTNNLQTYVLHYWQQEVVRSRHRIRRNIYGLSWKVKKRAQLVDLGGPVEVPNDDEQPKEDFYALFQKA